ncbi:MAG: GNAT family N-acetyltransferase [Pseudomonadota bacterium]
MKSEASPQTDITIRSELKPGDVGMITHLHGVIYAREYGLDLTFEPYVAKPLSDFVLAGPEAGRIWIAERNGAMVGCLALVVTSKTTGQLRWFLVTPQARGTGLGRTLLDSAVSYARACALQSVTLWTFDDLDAAISLYKDAGFRAQETKTSFIWGAERTELLMELPIPGRKPQSETA